MSKSASDLEVPYLLAVPYLTKNIGKPLFVVNKHMFIYRIVAASKDIIEVEDYRKPQEDPTPLQVRDLDPQLIFDPTDVVYTLEGVKYYLDNTELP